MTFRAWRQWARQLPVWFAMLGLLPGLTGCLVHTRSVQQPRMPSIVRDATADQLVRLVNQDNTSLRTLKATVTLQLSVGGERKGKVSEYTALSGYILLQKPEMLRVLGLLPVVHTPAFDLASDGATFTLLVPHTSKAYTGLTTVTTPAANPIENLRPNLFFDTMILRAIGPDDLVTRTSHTDSYRDEKTHDLLADPQYDLTVLRHAAGSQELVPERVIHFHRSTLEPSGVDVYDGAGRIETSAAYGPYEAFGEEKYPGTITINRPIEEYQIVLTITKLTVNKPLPANQFQLKVPESYTVKVLK